MTQKARGDKGQHCTHKALLVVAMTKVPHFGEVSGKDPMEMCWLTVEEDAVSSPHAPGR